MAAYFPGIYPDEVLASAVARKQAHTMSLSSKETHFELYGRVQHRTAINFPRNLAALHANIEINVRKTLDELIAETTLFPYYFAFDTEATRKKVMEHMIEKFEGTKAPIVIGWEPVFNRLRACPSCIKDDIKKFGEAYWHRTHQIDAVHICPHHGTPMLAAETRYFEHCRMPLEVLTPSTPLSKYLPRLTEKCRQRLNEIAKYAHSYLNGASPMEGPQPYTDEGRVELRRLYPFKQKTGMDMTRLETDIIEHFGEQCLEILGLPIRPGHTGSWVRCMFRLPTSPMPTKHIIMKILLTDFVQLRATEIIRRQDILHRLAHRPWPCLNPAAEHVGENVVTTTYKSKGYSRNGLIGFRCDCGYTYLVEEKNWDGENPPPPHSTIKFGDVFVNKVRSLHAEGHNCAQIGRQLGCDRATAQSMLSNEYRPRSIRTSSEARDIRTVRLNKEKGENPTIRNYVDFAARDLEFAGKVCEAADVLFNQVPPVRLSRHAIVKKSGIKETQLIRKHKYPNTLQTLEEISENAPNYLVRLNSWRERQQKLADAAHAL